MNRFAATDRRLSCLPAAISILTLVARPATGEEARAGVPEPTHTYVVVASQSTWADQAWREVIVTLREKYDASLVLYGVGPRASKERAAGAETGNISKAGKPLLAEIDAVREALVRWMPRYTCFVARPGELGRRVVVAIHRMTRALDRDAYTDTIWGILTGYDAADALRMARRRQPLVVRRGLGGTSALDLSLFDEGVGFDESRAGVRRLRAKGEPVHEEDWPADSTAGLVGGLNEFRPDLFMTSGHATARDWQIGYAYRDGQFRCEAGRLFGLDTKGRRIPIDSPNSKIYMPCGNCLIGDVPDRDCMALAFMHSAGVDQMFGYTAATFDGFMGWGTKELFLEHNGHYALSEAFYFNEQALLYELATRHPEVAGIEFEGYEIRDIEGMARRYELGREELGLLWDRDVVAFYGDPAWQVRMPPGECGYSEQFEENDGALTFRITTDREGRWGNRPVMAWLPWRLRDVVVERGEDYMPLVTDDFVLVPLRRSLRGGANGTFRQGESYEIVLRGKAIAGRPTSANDPPLQTAAAGGAAKETAPAPDLTLPADLSERDRHAVRQALSRAGTNAGELVAALEQTEGFAREAMTFLIANMPEVDLRSLEAGDLVENVNLALRAREAVPWGEALPDALFLDAVLPYACVNERREDWRRPFFEKLLGLVKDCSRPAEAAQILNREIFDLYNVHYHATKRPKADQSPFESITAGYASCTGLSIMLADACRSVCVPARLVGIPQWTTKRGNHSWVEIWDDGWHFTGAAEYDPKGLDRAWFMADAARADPDQRMHRIYASSFRRTSLRFPLVWNLGIDWVSARDVTSRYIALGERPNVRVQSFDRRGGERVSCHVLVWRDQELCGEGWTRDRRDDTNNMLELRLRPGRSYVVELERPEGRKGGEKLHRTVEPSGEEPVEIVFYLDES